MFFHTPDQLLWLAILPILILIYIAQIHRRNRRIKKWLKIGAKALTSSISSKKRILKTALQLLVLALLILALARPQSPGEKILMRNRGVYMLLLADASNSMLAEDIKPSRLDFMKKELARLIDMSSGDQIALGLFARSSVLAAPFTNDITVIKSYLNDLSTDYITNQGTNFERAFKFSEQVFSSIKETDTDHSFKALIIASDGEDHHSEKTKKAVKNLIAKHKVRIFTLSFGTNKGGVIPIKDNKGRLKDYKKDAAGRVVISRLRTDSLKQFAKWGKGSYYHASYTGKAIDQLRKDLDRLEKAEMEKSSYRRKKEHYQWFLLAALLIAFAELILSERKKRPSK